jgi:hypothetical protein
MKPHNWQREQGKGKGKGKGEKSASGPEPVNKDEETQFADEPPAPQKEGKAPDEATTVMEIRGEVFDPFEQLSVLVLVDIAPEVKERRGVPQFFHVKARETVLGTARRAQVKVDDLKTVKPEHGLLAFQRGVFRIYPLMDAISVDGEPVTKEGSALRNGSRIQMGSAEFVFLTIMEPEETGEVTEFMDDDIATMLSD